MSFFADKKTAAFSATIFIRLTTLNIIMYIFHIPNRTQIGQYMWKAPIEICLHPHVIHCADFHGTRKSLITFFVVISYAELYPDWTKNV